ncbi:UbiA family prenyltransferase [Nocardioides zhouii]|uniref:Ubiquinone biosynthesis protein UbiA n=1 Tax=Nocardioides zhouii TaxID=1168729 RepID=A0A4Q2T4X3_9ACTN|nr:UbiA family prenyltransferase [Nocardioides zhouii]RYC13855.1 hypothetical protein EUA94_04505 [Nocardioides zhouii]
MSSTASPATRPVRGGIDGLVRAAHAGPALAVTVLAGLLAVAQDLPAGRAALVVAAVLTGQLTVGWSNDLIDQGRDRSAGRSDKPLATGAVPVRMVQACCAVAVVCCVALSLACGVAAGLVHLTCVAAAWAYNLRLKSTVWSWVPYAVAFGLLTVFVALADEARPPWWWPVGAALLGVGAHLLNVLPDLDDDASTGVRGLPHVLGPRRIAPIAATVLVAATVVVLVGAAPATLVVVPSAAVVLALALVVVAGSGRRPFVAAIGIALVDAALLVVAR